VASPSPPPSASDAANSSPPAVSFSQASSFRPSSDDRSPAVALRAKRAVSSSPPSGRGGPALTRTPLRLFGPRSPQLGSAPCRAPPELLVNTRNDEEGCLGRAETRAPPPPDDDARGGAPRYRQCELPRELCVTAAAMPRDTMSLGCALNGFAIMLHGVGERV